MSVVFLKAGHVQPVWAGHPWVFAQAIERIEGTPQPGDDVTVQDARGNALGRGLYSPGSAIPVRLFTRDCSEAVDDALFTRRIERALERRRMLGLPSAETNAVRLVHGEGDDLPGLIVDLLGNVLSVQVGTVGVHRRLDAILDALSPVGASAIVDRTSDRTAKTEGFSPRGGILRGDPNVAAFQFQERALEFQIPFELGQKTGFYVDQRPLRARIEELAKGRSVLDAYSYVGACALAAARGGASRVKAVDSSGLAMEVGAECARRNGLHERIQFEQGDARVALQDAAREGKFDLVICDPPKLAPNRGARRRAVDLMRKLSAHGVRATEPGGLFVLCSCSAAIGLEEMTRALALGGRDAGMRATVLERHSQGADHPVPAAFPEGLYLASVIAQIEPWVSRAGYVVGERTAT